MKIMLYHYFIRTEIVEKELSLVLYYNTTI